MIAALALLVLLQLAGEALVAWLRLPLPGPVAGMALLCAVLLVRGRVPDSLSVAGDALARHLSLLFVPAGVGVMLYARQLASEWMPIVVALVVSTVLAIAVAAWVFARLARHAPGNEAP
ncbi:MAG TPA: CidA/LrgA family protein [Casimicrobiaceae bacterium]|nr:CidA/LrgA family protein [Casimicrobiaceae bacterium]